MIVIAFEIKNSKNCLCGKRKLDAPPAASGTRRPALHISAVITSTRWAGVSFSYRFSNAIIPSATSGETPSDFPLI